MKMLAERGVNNPEDLVNGVVEGELDGAFGAVKYWDELPHQGPRSASPGLLVSKIREGGLPGYKPPHERTSVEGTIGLTSDRMKNMRGVLATPDGMTREEAESLYSALARQLGTSPQSLIESVMGPGWFATPPHPGLDDADVIAASVRYMIWLNGHCNVAPDLECLPEDGESEQAWAMRFWGWKDPENIEQLISLERARRALRRAPAQLPSAEAGDEPGDKGPQPSLDRREGMAAPSQPRDDSDGVAPVEVTRPPGHGQLVAAGVSEEDFEDE